MEKRKKIIRLKSDQDQCESMAVEFIAGPFDGMRLFLQVVREGRGHIRVLEAGYTAPEEKSAGSIETAKV
ncbi:MAG: hypothetical protein ACXU9Z_07620 [Gemmatimonadaceae bacterium]